MSKIDEKTALLDDKKAALAFLNGSEQFVYKLRLKKSTCTE